MNPRSCSLLFGAALIAACHPAAAPPEVSAPAASALVAPAPVATATADTAPSAAPADTVSPEHPEAPAAATLPLFRRHPALASTLAHVALGTFPTPAPRAEALGKHLGIAHLYVKRDDLSGEVVGGNKVRKLEFDLGEAKRLGKTTILTFGSVGSNQALATAVHARRLGMKTIALLLPEPASERVRQMLLAVHKAGAEIRYPAGPAQLATVLAELKKTRAPGDEPYVIPPGGSGVLGNIGFVNAAFELKEQIDAGLLPEPDVIYLALGTMGSVVGLCLGLEAAGMKAKVVAVRASSPSAASEAKMIALFDATNDHLRSLDPSFPKLTLGRGRVRIEHGQVGRGYAQPTAKGAAAASTFASFIGVPLETTYTGKTFAALIDDRAQLADKVVLFWDTFSSRPLDASGVNPDALPTSLRGYFPKAAR